MTTFTPRDATVIPLYNKLVNLNTNDVSESWYKSAVHVLRGGDGGEHGLLLYKLVRRLDCERQPVILEVGTARGFSAITMARALIDGNLGGTVFTVDVIDHHSKLSWHVSKQDSKDPLVNISISRSDVWSRWFEEESGRVVTLHAQAHEVLENWNNGPIEVAFIDGEHTYDAVRRELSQLEHLMSPTGVIVLDDYHTGVSMGAFRSRPANGAVRLMGHAMKRVWPSMSDRLHLGVGNEFLLVKRRFAGVYKAVAEFYIERSSEWSLEIVSMPPRGDYHETDYSLAVLTRVRA